MPSTPTLFLLPENIFTSVCALCHAPGTELSPLIICPGCSMTAHCSEQCRKEDIRHGPKFCLLRPHLELGQLYPFIAWAAEFTRLQNLVVQPALWHKIKDGPGSVFTRHPHAKSDTQKPCVIRYGAGIDMYDVPSPQDPICQGRLLDIPQLLPDFYSPPLFNWFPSCFKLTQRAYLLRRISRDGYLLPLVMGMGIAVLLELFSLTKETPIPPCLHFLGNPIYDFGICRGKLRVEPYRIVTYIKEGSNEPPTQHQNPEEHFWLYFTTEGERETLYLDVGLFVYGYRYHVTNAEQYLPLEDHKEARGILQVLLQIPSSMVEFLDPHAPAHFSDERLRDEMRHQDCGLHEVTQRFSILRDKELTDALQSGARRTQNSLIGKRPWGFEKGTVDVLYEYMKKADLDSKTLGRPNIEMMFLMDTIYNGARILRNILDGEKWKNLPEPRIENCKWELGLNPRGQDP